jgi:hypothetical protein
MDARKRDRGWHFARLCWNTQDWKIPSGSARETGTFFEQHNYGLEEWLYSQDRIGDDSLRYGFIQGILNSYNKVKGSYLSIVLYTLSPTGARYFVGHVYCYVLEEDEASRAYAFFERNGTIARMVEQLAPRLAGHRQHHSGPCDSCQSGPPASLTRHIQCPSGGPPAGIIPEVWNGAHNVFNIRYHPDHLHTYRIPVPRSHKLWKRHRYQLNQMRAGEAEALKDILPEFTMGSELVPETRAS